MQLDDYTYQDLSVFHPDEEFSVFHRLNFTRTDLGKDTLLQHFRTPTSNKSTLLETQQCIRILMDRVDDWPTDITNGTLLVIHKFYDYQLDPLPRSADLLNSYLYRILHTPDFALTRYSLTHFADFLRGMRKILQLIDSQKIPKRLDKLRGDARHILQIPLVKQLADPPDKKTFSTQETIRFGHFLKESFASRIHELIGIFAQLDAWYSMALAMKTYQLHFPELLEQDEPSISAEGMYHLLLSNAVPYDITMNRQTNFIFLTGANMAGKSTFIKSIGLAVYLSHIGMGVPARSMRLSIFEGILTNINVTDNIVRGESFFFNEVQRIKNTVLRINNGKKWLVLIDELFKGTNIQDAMKCSLAVIRGLINIRQTLFILSTHLYEIGDDLKNYNNITFRYFETQFTDDQLSFSYQLKEGISNDRLGYLILQREGVVDLLQSLEKNHPKS